MEKVINAILVCRQIVGDFACLCLTMAAMGLVYIFAIVAATT